ncbi:hypothetical protein C9I92_13765 [Photobacterium ganghwense]|uniref:Uncharacterized protein n=2 Tax=Photobacterium ganghwense TaxID=320778 RepID=A0A0J1HCP2_9GAMM|nr:hypothetical protein [Photobacterium ganghwense]KLV09415.1 hypothetical protein ABT57_11395 [Photobacterium ganghwense]PSU08565.1 hypothetical protein C9I92_13765 [Photobacterium ganghwense]QSV15370.1 hypothetical protein FH974_07320 [Photobacterium ganghwense]
MVKYWLSCLVFLFLFSSKSFSDESENVPNKIITLEYMGINGEHFEWYKDGVEVVWNPHAPKSNIDSEPNFFGWLYISHFSPSFLNENQSVTIRRKNALKTELSTKPAAPYAFLYNSGGANLFPSEFHLYERNPIRLYVYGYEKIERNTTSEKSFVYAERLEYTIDVFMNITVGVELDYYQKMKI